MDKDAFHDAIGRRAGVRGLAFDERGCARIVFDGRHVVDLEWDAERGALQLCIALGPAPRDAAFLRSLLMEHLFGRAPGGATYAVDPGTEDLLAFGTVRPGTPGIEEAAQLLEGMLNLAEGWEARRPAEEPAPMPVSFGLRA
jgi:hypothetical protein